MYNVHCTVSPQHFNFFFSLCSISVKCKKYIGCVGHQNTKYPNKKTAFALPSIRIFTLYALAPTKEPNLLAQCNAPCHNCVNPAINKGPP